MNRSTQRATRRPSVGSWVSLESPLLYTCIQAGSAGFYTEKDLFTMLFERSLSLLTGHRSNNKQGTSNSVVNSCCPTLRPHPLHSTTNKKERSFKTFGDNASSCYVPGKSNFPGHQLSWEVNFSWGSQLFPRVTTFPEGVNFSRGCQLFLRESTYPEIVNFYQGSQLFPRESTFFQGSQLFPRE